MSSTPYAPPAARVSDLPAAPRTRPQSARRAVTLLWTSVAIAVLATGGQLLRVTTTAEFLQVCVTGVLGASLLALVAAKAGAGRGWARWFYLVLYVLGSFFFVVAGVLMPEMFLALPLFDRMTAVVQFSLQTAALVLLFTPASRAWFAADS